LAKFRVANRLTKSTFKLTATKQTYDFSVASCMSNDLKCLPINFYLLTMFDALCDVTPQEQVTLFIMFRDVFFIFVTFLTFFYYFDVNVFYIYTSLTSVVAWLNFISQLLER